MGVSNRALGLRERKKIRTRDSIRDEAVRLFDENGYANTTIEQIAEAAEVSPSTFFRYFPNKESVLITDDMDCAMVEALLRQPADMPALKAFRCALHDAMATISEDQWKFERRRHELFLEIPEAKAAQYDSYLRTAVRLVEAECQRTGRNPGDDFYIRVFIGAVSGALMAVLDKPSEAIERMYRALDFVEAGMPL